MVIFHNMHFCPSKHGIHKISSLSGNYGNNLHVRLTLDFLVIFPNSGHGVGDGDTRQAATARERKSSDAGHGVGNGDARQAAAFPERILTDACH